jgi:hypothetical protein
MLTNAADGSNDEAHADFFLHKDKIDHIKKLLPTGAFKIHTDTEEVEADSLFHRKLDLLKKLLPTGHWKWDAEHEDAEGQFFLPQHKLNSLKKLLPTGHWKWDADHEALAASDEKTFFLSHKFAEKLPTGPHKLLPTGPFHWTP